jgi:hypothetical protein
MVRLMKECVMLVLGGVLAAVALLLVACLAPILRVEPGPRWSRIPLLVELIAVAIAGSLTVGLTLIAVGVLREIERGLDLINVGLLAAAMAVGLAIWRRLQQRTSLARPATSPTP